MRFERIDKLVAMWPGDCREAMRRMDENFIDSVVTDPPYHLNFMNKSWDVADVPAIDPAFANWFAGFVDGEGCFSVHKKNVNGFETYDCQFSMTLRADDKPIILEIRDQLGGIGSIADRPAPKSDERNAKPQVRYCISSQRDCQRLRAILEVFPLRAKKARDFEIWCHGLDAWLAHEPKSSWEEVAYFRKALMDVRQYGAGFHPSQLWAYRWARECLRVLKPGGHLVAFGGTRTSHRMICAIEDAGFEIRDTLMWVYGQGFPKSLDVSKAIDEHYFQQWLDAHPIERVQYDEQMRQAGDSQARDHVKRKFRKMAGTEREVVGVNEAAIRNKKRDTVWTGDVWGDNGATITAPATDAARQWGGFGTSLKPAWEPIVLARKPLSERAVAANVLRWGTGALNINGCRIHTAGSESKAYTVRRMKPGATLERTGGNWRPDDGIEYHGKTKDGRWPSNVILDGSEEVVGMFPESVSSNRARTHKHKASIGYDRSDVQITTFGHNDSGSAARFFYHAKANKTDRAGSKHPTIKPIALLQWLCRLVTPPGGCVLDPFAGSGTTGTAAMREGFQSVLCEAEAEYQGDIRRRFSSATQVAAE